MFLSIAEFTELWREKLVYTGHQKNSLSIGIGGEWVYGDRFEEVTLKENLT